MEWAAPLDEYEKLVIRMNTPRVVVDNAVCPTATLVKVDGSHEQRVLLEAVQLLADLDLSIRKAYISSDGRWFMDVFHVTNLNGRKLADDRVVSYMEQSLGPGSTSKSGALEGLTALELMGTDRLGLLSEIFAVLADLRCDVVDAKVWTHNGRMASLVFVRYEDSGSSLEGSPKIRLIEARLLHVLRTEYDARGARVALSAVDDVTHGDRRLHQMMFEDRDYDRVGWPDLASGWAPSVSVQNCVERGYSTVIVQCGDRSKLLFDVLCSLTDMEYVVFHGTIDTDGDRAYQEFYVRHSDGSPISSEAERQRVIQCLQAAIERRASEGLRLELCTADGRGLLVDVTRTFRENGLSVRMAEISTKGHRAVNVFYVTDATGQPADPVAIDAVLQRIGRDILKVKEKPRPRICHERSSEEEVASFAGGLGLFYLGNLVKRNLYNLGLIKSY